MEDYGMEDAFEMSKQEILNLMNEFVNDMKKCDVRQDEIDKNISVLWDFYFSKIQKIESKF
jgi:hypothetical protein